MPEKNKILWVEDSARFELPFVLGPIYASHRYDLTLAENATTAAEYLRRRSFDAIIVDIRLPPGPGAFWRALFKNHESDRTNAKLGLELLRWLLGAESADESPRDHRRFNNGAAPPKRPSWTVEPSRVGVFSVESRLEIGEQLKELGVDLMYEKQPGLPDTILLDIVTEVLSRVE